MKVLKILERPSEKLAKRAASGASHPQEDYLLASKKYPIFAVADGVTLLLNEGDTYPNPSGASEVAKVFCQKAIETAENLYPDFSERDVLGVFDTANQAIRKYNESCNRTEKTIDFGTFDFFHATAAAAVVKENKIFWANICDANLALFDGGGVKKFDSTSHWQESLLTPPPTRGYQNWTEIEKGTYTHRFFRNKINEKGERTGYGCLTGEKEALRYVNHGALSCEENDILFIFSDGFESYLRLPEFVNMFTQWPDRIEEKIRRFTSVKAEENPAQFGRERSLIAVKL